MTTGTYDIAVIGGGINGCGIARDAAGRGLKVLLCEKSDLASATSSASTKLIHGGLRYLEHYEFGLVRESLSEREVLWGMAPHIIWPLRFVLPHNKSQRPAWMIRLGLFLYDHLGGRKLLPASRTLNLRSDPAGAPLKGDLSKAFEYSDCWVEDARLVVLNAMDATAHGADVRVRTEVTRADREEDHWRITLTDSQTGETSTATAKVIVNAAGPWVAETISQRLGINSKSSVRLVKGSHIVVPKMFDHDRAYIFQNADERIVFAIPYERDFTLIGTTDVEFDQPPGPAKITDDEISYLCEAASAYFTNPVTPADVVWTYSGVRPLYDDGEGSAQEVTRDFVLEREGPSNGPALLNVFGGKLTTYRRLAQDALEKLEDCFPKMGRPWTRGATLPGGDFAVEGFDNLCRMLANEKPNLPEPLIRRLARAYGTRSRDILSGAETTYDLGECFGHDLFEREVRYLVENEWARTAEDIVWRRSKLGLRIDPASVQRLDQWLAAQFEGNSPASLATAG